MTELSFPPQLYGERSAGDPLELAVLRAIRGCDAGLVTYRISALHLSAALVLAPDVPLGDAMAMLPLCGVGFQNALGALAPPEVAVHLDWSGGIRINGATCGALTAIASDRKADAVPDWLAIGLTLALLPDSDDPGHEPDRTALFVEGCADVEPAALVEAWARHTMGWISRWESEGAAPLHAEWRGLAFGIGEEVTRDGRTGVFLGTDERFGMLLRDGEGTHLIPLTTLLKDAP